MKRSIYKAFRMQVLTCILKLKNKNVLRIKYNINYFKFSFKKIKKSVDAIYIHFKLDYSKFFGGFLVNLTSHFQSFVLLELLDGPECAATELTINFQVVSFV